MPISQFFDRHRRNKTIALRAFGRAPGFPNPSGQAERRLNPTSVPGPPSSQVFVPQRADFLLASLNLTTHSNSAVCLITYRICKAFFRDGYYAALTQPRGEAHTTDYPTRPAVQNYSVSGDHAIACRSGHDSGVGWSC